MRHHPRMETFVLRLRSVTHSQTESDLRGVLQHVRTGEEVQFEDFRQLEALLSARIQAAAVDGDPDPALAPQPS